MNFPVQDLHSFWDISQQPDTFSALPDDDFLAFLQKQFPGTAAANPPLFDNPDGVDPQSISNFPPPNLSPPSSDSSPSPPSTHNESSLSRRQSGSFNGADGSQDDGSLKRKASIDPEDEPQHKSQHTTSSSTGTHKKTSSSASARRKPGAAQDETRLLKRKEQNRAAQRAFRERKEKHVRDLEDKVAQLEQKNQLSEQENENLRELLTRLQNENMVLKQAAFTFSAPRGNATATPQNQFSNHGMQFNFSSPGAGPSRSPVQPQAQPPQNGLNFNSLISFDPNMLNPDDTYDTTMTDAPFSYAANHYKTIASNPLFTSFAEPSPSDSPPLMLNGSQQFTPGSFEFGEHWTPPDGGNQDALDQLFSNTFVTPNNTSTVDFQALLASPPSSLSPVSHRTPSLTSSSSSPSLTTATPSTACNSPHGTGDCPKTKEQLSKAIAESGPSSFVQSPPAQSPAASDDMNVDHGSCDTRFAPFLKKTTGEDGSTPFVMCRGSSFPKTQKSDKNVEVLTAWRTITSNPQFKDVDINELCTEFTNKARCDGTKVVLEPEGVHHIIETLAARQAQSQSKQ
ncbi:hypothetical protein OH76DRAFT_1417238 [Lentinus brumalis]|uniref:BZIP domain-containing protein n=1 Tax=Lentinus brumalis TaxID=2498619 RepID=A0A371DG40_9APHY|nr:hypothetical protein OH76DRAFT_1417238 [Polyporus brumalis]